MQVLRLLSLGILAVADVYPRERLAFPEFENPFRRIEKRNTFIERNLNQLQRRQSLESCIIPCASIETALSCTTGPCICPILNSAGLSAVATCANCLEGVDASYASELILLANVCTMCSNQCSGVVTAIIQTELSCTTTACECSLFSQVGAASIETCASCVQSFDPTDASTLLDTEQACGIGVASPPVSPPASPPPPPSVSSPPSPPASPASPPSLLRLRQSLLQPYLQLQRHVLSPADLSFKRPPVLMQHAFAQ